VKPHRRHCLRLRTTGFFGLCNRSPASGLLQVVFGLFCASAYADYQTGFDAYRAGDYETAMAEWKAEINRPGEPENLAVHRESLYAIGMLYWQGEGVAQDYTVAAVWLKQAADINHSGAQNKLGYLYSTGQGVPQNFQQAKHYFEMAAAQGDPDASHNLDQMFRQGLLTETGGGPAAPAPTKESLAQQEKVWGDNGIDWIRAQNPEYYTIQVVALRAPDKLHDFITAHPDWAPFAIYQPAGNALPLSVLVQGAYADVEAARAAAQVFPPGIQQREQLWIRKFGKVQGMIE